MYTNFLALLGRPVMGCWVRYTFSYELECYKWYQSSGSAKALSGFRKFDCALDEDVDHIRGGVCNIPRQLVKEYLG